MRGIDGWFTEDEVVLMAHDIACQKRQDERRSYVA